MIILSNLNVVRNSTFLVQGDSQSEAVNPLPEYKIGVSPELRYNVFPRLLSTTGKKTCHLRVCTGTMLCLNCGVICTQEQVCQNHFIIHTLRLELYVQQITCLSDVCVCNEPPYQNNRETFPDLRLLSNLISSNI